MIMSKLGKLETISWWWHALSEVKWKQVNTDVDYYVWCNTWQLVDSQILNLTYSQIRADIKRLRVSQTGHGKNSPKKSKHLVH